MIRSNRAIIFHLTTVRHEKEFQSNLLPKAVKVKSKGYIICTCGLRSMVHRTEFSLHRKYDPEKWISDKGRVKGKTEDVKALNKYLDSVQSRIYEIFQTLVSSGTELNGENIKARYLGQHIEQKRMLMDVYEAHNLEFKQLVGKGFSYKTLPKYRTIKGYVLEFVIHE